MILSSEMKLPCFGVPQPITDSIHWTIIERLLPPQAHPPTQHTHTPLPPFFFV